MSSTRKNVADRIDVAYVARLARLNLSEAERDRFQAQLDDILGYVRKIAELDVSDVEPTSHAGLVENVLREDMVSPGLDPDAALRNAPSHNAGQFIVPRILE